MSDSMLIDREISNGADVSVTESHQHQSLKIYSEKSFEVVGASATDMQWHLPPLSKNPDTYNAIRCNFNPSDSLELTQPAHKQQILWFDQ